MPVTIRIINEGSAIRLNRLPTVIISEIRSSSDIDVFFKMGARTTPKNNPPPTQIAAEVR